MDQSPCPFCHIEKSRIYLDNDLAAAFADAFPVADGHTPVIPNRHVASLFDLSAVEQTALWRLVALVRAKLLSEQIRYSDPQPRTLPVAVTFLVQEKLAR